MAFLLFLSFAFSTVFTMGVLLVSKSLATDYAEDMPQRFHLGHTPRIGGVGMLLGFAVSLLAMMAVNQFVSTNVKLGMAQILLWLLVAAPIVLVGFFEDVTQSVGVKWRLLAAMVSAVVAVVFFDASVNRIDLKPVDWLLSHCSWLGIAIAIFAMAGLPHAINIIDGYNGLAGMVVVMICAALAYVALQAGDRELAAIAVALAGASLGFLFWNYPRGLIFAGDGGAYFWGIMIALLGILLVQRHPQVSPWFPMLLLIYPVWETVFSIYRKLVRGQSPGMADSMHFHQLVYKRIVRGVFHDNRTRQMLMRNNRTSPYLWGFSGLTVIPAALFWYSTPILMFFCGLFLVSYVAAYLMIVRFKVPRWLHSSFHESTKKPPF